VLNLKLERLLPVNGYTSFLISMESTPDPTLPVSENLSSDIVGIHSPQSVGLYL
jgi:hypothetical protein